MPVRKTDASTGGAKPFKKLKRFQSTGKRPGVSSTESIALPDSWRKTKQHDWPAARELFMTSQPAINLRQLSLRTGIPYDQIRTRSSKERWMAMRAQEQTAVLKARRQEFLQTMAGQAITFDETSIDVAKLGQGIIAGRLIEITKLLDAAGAKTDLVIAKLKAGIPLEKSDLYSMVNYKELASLAQAALMFQEIGRKAFGQEIIDGSLLKEGESEGLEEVVSIGGELSKDDPKRLAAFLEALERTGMTMLNLQPEGDATAEDTDQVVTLEGEIVPPVPQIEAGPVQND